jgi:negative regulator of sigma E activity
MINHTPPSPNRQAELYAGFHYIRCLQCAFLQTFVYLQHKALVSLKQQHAELDGEIEQKIVDLNAAQQKCITLKGETIDA